MQSADDVVLHDLEFMKAGLEHEWKHLAGKRLLITGGAGFLGYYLVQAITHWNASCKKSECVDVTVYDNFVRGVPGWLTQLEQTGALHVRRHDICAPLPADCGLFHWIVHAASIASPTYYRAHPIETMDGNVNGLRNLLDYALRRSRDSEKVAGLLFFSSSEIYGDPDPAHIPTPESYRGNVSCTGPRACYDEAKRYGETLCVAFARHHGLPARIVRPFNNYGPGLKITDGRVLPDFARDVFSEKDLVMLSDGSATRTFCYVADAVVGYYKALTRGTPGEAYNIGTELPEISVKELAHKVAGLSRELFGYRGKVVCQASQDRDYLVDNPNRRAPVIDKARRELGFDPAIGLDDGLRRSLLWYRENQAAPAECWSA